jgi:hypothetical protein
MRKLCVHLQQLFLTLELSRSVRKSVEIHIEEDRDRKMGYGYLNAETLMPIIIV